MQIRCTKTVKLISAFVFASCSVQPLYFLNLKSQAPSHLLWLSSLASVGPGRKTPKTGFLTTQLIKPFENSTYFSKRGGTINSGLIVDRCFKASAESPLPYLLNMLVNVTSIILLTKCVMSSSVSLWLSGTGFHHLGFWYLSLKR